MVRPENRPRTRRGKSWIWRVLFWCAATALALLVAVVIAMPWILRAAVPDAFARFGIEASVTGGGLNPLRREITLEGFTLGAPDAPALTLGELGIGLGLRALLDGRIKLRHLRVKDVNLNAERLVALRNELDTQTTSGRSGLPVELDELALEDVRLVSLGERIGHDVRIDSLDVRGLSALLADGRCSVALQGVVGEGGLDLQLDVGLDDGKVRAAGTYHIDKVPANGWPRLAGPDIDPIVEGAVTGRGDIHVDYALDGKKLGVTLDGRVGVTGLDVDFASVEAKDGDASWQGRLALEWSPEESSPTFRGDGGLEVGKVQMAGAESSRAPFRAVVSDISWQGDFDWRGGFTSQGAVLGTSVEVIGASGGKPAWRVHAEDFSSRLIGRVAEATGALDGRVEDFDLARLTVAVTESDAPVDVSAEKVRVDELRGAPSGNIVLGLASVDTLVVTATPGKGDTTTLRAGGLRATGVSGDLSDKLHAAHLGAESLDFERAKQRVRADEIVLASIGFGVPAWVGAGELHVKSVRAEHGDGDIWVSALQATKLRGDAGGSFGAETVDVAHMFQSGAADLSWEATALKLRGLHGDIDDSGKAAAVDLAGLKIGFHDASWEAAGLHASELAAALNGTVSVAGIDLAKLERRHPGAGDLRVSELGAHALRIIDSHGALEGLKAARLEFDTPAGNTFDVHGIEAWNIGGDLTAGLDASRFSAARGSGSLAGGERLGAGDFEVRKLTISTAGAVAAGDAKLGTFSHTAADAAAVELKETAVAGLRWRPAGPLSAATAAVKTARYSRADGPRWDLADFDTGDLNWDGADHVKLARAALGSVSQSRGKAQDWQARRLEATGFGLVLPAGIDVTTLTAGSLHGGSGSPDWGVDSVDVQGFKSSADHGQDIAALTSGAVTVTDAGSGAALDLDHVAMKSVKVGASGELSAAALGAARLRIRSSDPDWPARLTVAKLRAANPSLGLDGVVDLGHVEAHSPYLIVAQSEDNVWMFPPLPGVEDRPGAGEQKRSTGGVRVASFNTSGPGRIAYIDRATEPAFHLVFDPLVVALQNLDTSLPGNVARFRVRGTGSRYSGVKSQGELRTAVHGFDLSLTVDVKGADLPLINPYVALHEPFAITTGRGDSYNDITIKNEQLTGEVKLLLSGLQMQSTLGGGLFQRIDPASFPIRTALALLKDRQGDISLQIPLNADTREEKSDFIDNFQEDFIKTVTTAGRAAANIPGKTLDGALRLLERTVSILPGVDATRYEPIPFAPGGDDFTARPLTYLDQLGKRMSVHTSLELALCGRAVTQDVDVVVAPSAGIGALFAEASAGVYRAFAPGPKGMLALADARSDMVRRYLHEIHKIPPARLAACEPKFDDSPGAVPRVVLEVKTPARRTGLFGILP
jgi:hypothetical protein